MVIFHSYVSLPEGTGHIWPFWEKQICLIPLQMCRDRLKTRRKRGPWVWWSLFGERWPRLVEAPRWRSEPVRAMQPGSLRGADFCGDFAWGFDFIFKKKIALGHCFSMFSSSQGFHEWTQNPGILKAFFQSLLSGRVQGLTSVGKPFFLMPFEGSVGEHVPSLMSFRCDHLGVIAETVGIHVPQFLWCPVNTKGYRCPFPALAGLIFV